MLDDKCAHVCARVCVCLCLSVCACTCVCFLSTSRACSARSRSFTLSLRALRSRSPLLAASSCCWSNSWVVVSRSSSPCFTANTHTYTHSQDQRPSLSSEGVRERQRPSWSSCRLVWSCTSRLRAPSRSSDTSSSSLCRTPSRQRASSWTKQRWTDVRRQDPQ